MGIVQFELNNKTYKINCNLEDETFLQEIFTTVKNDSQNLMKTNKEISVFSNDYIFLYLLIEHLSSQKDCKNDIHKAKNMVKQLINIVEN